MTCPGRLALIAVLIVAAAGCGGEKSPSASSTSADPVQEQSKSGDPAQSGSTVRGSTTTVSMSDFDFAPQRLSAKAGKLRVTAENDGRSPHEFVLIRTRKAPRGLPTKGNEASEAGAVGEIPEQEPGHSASHVFRLKPGSYVFICNVPGHYKAGMSGRLTVE